jgi:O-acetyl-ADP-ribose deacetylase (regulator of RNase III)
VYAFPVQRAARIAVKEVRDALARGLDLQKVYLVAFGGEVHAALAAALAQERG